MKELLTAFLQDCRTQQGLAVSTVANYRQGIHVFLVWLETKITDEPALSDFTADNLAAHDAHCKTTGIRERSRYVRNAALRAFGRWLVTQGHLTDNPAEKVKITIREKPKQNVVSECEVRALLDACKRLRNPLKGTMLHTALSLLAMTGLRKGEMLGIEVADIDLSNRSLCVRAGKGNKQGFCRLNTTVCAALSEWLRIRPKSLLPNLFVYGALLPLTENIFERALSNLVILAGLRGATHITSHAFRRYLATSLSRKQGVSLRDIQEILRHSSIQTTLLYMQTNAAHLQEVIEMATLEAPAAPPPATSAPKPTEDNRTHPPADRRKKPGWRRG